MVQGSPLAQGRMDYLEFFGLNQEPFSHAPVSRYYYSSRQHTEALKRLLYVGQTMKGLAILVGDIGHGKTTLARRMLDALPESEFEAAMLVIVHAGVTANWLLKRIATQLGVKEPAEDKLAILSQLYERLVEIHKSGKKAVVLIDEAQMLGTRELMEEFRGMLNLEVPGHKLISFVFFGLPEIESNLRLDPPLAQRVALRYHLKPLSVEDTAAYVQHRLRLAGSKEELIPPAAMREVHQQTRGVPRVINTLCDNVLLEMFFAKNDVATPELVAEVAQNLGIAERDLPPPPAPPVVVDEPALPGTQGEDAIEAIERSDAPLEDEPMLDADAIAARVADEGVPDVAVAAPVDQGPPVAPVAKSAVATTVDIDDPLAFLAGAQQVTRPLAAQPASLPSARMPATDDLAPPLDIPGVSPGIPSLLAPKPPAASTEAAIAELTLDDIAEPEPVLPIALPASAPEPVVVVKPKPPPAPARRSTIDLSAIDDLLADLKK